MLVEHRFPRGEATPVDALLASLEREPEGGWLQPGDERVVDFLSALARRLLTPALARRFPELGSLGFFLRPAELRATARRLSTADGATVRVPRGLVVHFPPANVDTTFVYSWALSALGGNRNVVRLSRRSGAAADAILDALEETLADAHPAVAQTQRVVSYDRDDAVTAALSAAADARVLWGGDGSVTELRGVPSGPLCHDLAFPDRSSFAAVASAAWLGADEERRDAAAEAFVNDVFWFDQAACSSPRVVFWVGEESETADARADFVRRVLAAREQRGWPVDPAMSVRRRVLTYALAASGAATRVEQAGPATTHVVLRDAADAPREWLGAGTVCHARVDTLPDLASVLVRKDQTLTHFGLSRDELLALVRATGGRGLDRVVPMGQALAFAAVWDGYDLVDELTRLVTVRG